MTVQSACGKAFTHGTSFVCFQMRRLQQFISIRGENQDLEINLLILLQALTVCTFESRERKLPANEYIIILEFL